MRDICRERLVSGQRIRDREDDERRSDTSSRSVFTARRACPWVAAAIVVAISGRETTAPSSKMPTKACSAPVRSAMICAYVVSLMLANHTTAAAPTNTAMLTKEGMPGSRPFTPCPEHS